MILEKITTPALVVDEEIYEKNKRTMVSLLEGKKIRLRPHYKSHKCSDIALEQIKNGAVGMTCAKLSEALDLADAGVENILIANQVVDEEKLSRLAWLAGVCRLTVCVDNEKNIRDISRYAVLSGNTVHCLIEYDIGMERCGVTTHAEVLTLARLIGSLEGVELDGIQAYAGHMSHEISVEARESITNERMADLKALISLLEENGIPVHTLSGGSTGTALQKTRHDFYTELQAGSYLFMDSTYRLPDTPFESSLFVLATVVSVRDGLAVVDAGVKSCGVDQGMPVPVGFDVEKIVASEEHFQLHKPSRKLRLGDKVLLVPGHCCSTVNLHDRLYFFRDGKVTRRVPVTARGCFK